MNVNVCGIQAHVGLRRCQSCLLATSAHHHSLGLADTGHLSSCCPMDSLRSPTCHCAASASISLFFPTLPAIPLSLLPSRGVSKTLRALPTHRTASFPHVTSDHSQLRSCLCPCSPRCKQNTAAMYSHTSASIPFHILVSSSRATVSVLAPHTHTCPQLDPHRTRSDGSGR